MYKIARSRPFAAAVRVARISSLKSEQKRFLSIHEYLSANLLKTVGQDIAPPPEAKLTMNSMELPYLKARSRALRLKRRR